MAYARSSSWFLWALLAVAPVRAEDLEGPPAPGETQAEAPPELPQPDDAARAEALDNAVPTEVLDTAAPQASVLDGALAMAAPERQPVRVVHHHFTDGPRAVPRARGASLARAQALGIGGHAATRELLWTRPGPELLAAVPGKPPTSLLWPVVGGTWGRGFGYTRKIRVDLRHNGLDIGAEEGAAVRAAAEGLVIYSDNTLTGFGNAVMILHPGGWTTLYGHNQRNTVQPGYYVKRGERIAIVGHTGMAWGPHLHFEFRDNGRWRDPERLLVGNRDRELQGLLIDLSTHPPAPAVDPVAARKPVARSNAAPQKTSAPQRPQRERVAQR